MFFLALANFRGGVNTLGIEDCLNRLPLQSGHFKNSYNHQTRKKLKIG